MENEFRVSQLLYKKLIDGLTDIEQEELDDWQNECPENKQFVEEYLGHKKALHEDLQLFQSFSAESSWESLQSQERDSSKLRRYWWVIPIAASILLAFTWYVFNGSKQESTLVAEEVITPGSEKAIIKFDDGRELILQENEGGVIWDSTSLRYQNGDLISSSDNNSKGLGGTLFQIATPVGGQYKIQLPDGSKVHLNASSSVHYVEDDTSRTVELVGEAYFEVSSLAIMGNQNEKVNKPFIVNSGNQQVKVLGTAFNIKAYSGEKTYTTLVEGQVELQTGSQKLTLIPGEQAALEDNQLSKYKADLSSALGWTTGTFVFNDEPLEEILRQVERWYDVTFSYQEKALQEERFEVFLPRFSNLTEFLELLEKTGEVKFEVVGRKVLVSQVKAE